MKPLIAPAAGERCRRSFSSAAGFGTFCASMRAKFCNPGGRFARKAGSSRQKEANSN